MMSERRMRFDEFLTKFLLVSVACWMLGIAVQAQTIDPVSIGKRAETLGIIGILAAVIVILALGLVLVYRGKEAAALRREDRLEKLIEKTASALSEDAETRRDTNSILLEFRNVIEHCRRHGG
jgi:type VI protein secretion system component VasK